ncbi:hypothetical protein DIZ76_014275 [Coccidioides immitis]|nr:hypothetical protein DIZ76_014275 [Coccidioides immitis]
MPDTQPSVPEVSQALEVITSASSATLLDLEASVRKAVESVCRKLAEGHAPATVKLLDYSLKTLEKINAFLSLPVEDLLQRTWTNEDPSITDLCLALKDLTDWEKYLCFLAEWSLALEKEAWEKQTCGLSCVDILTNNCNPKPPREKFATIHEFLKYKEIPDDKTVYLGIKQGQKYLVAER